MVQANLYEDFLARFQTLKQVARDEPSRLQTFFSQHKNIRSAVMQLYFLLFFDDFERRVFHSNVKYHAQVPVDFENEWKDFKKRWENAVTTVAFPELAKALGTDLGEDFDATELIGDGELKPPDAEKESHFDPRRHDGSAAVDDVLWLADAYASNDEDVLSVQTRIGLEAWDYLTKTIGLDVNGIFHRWRQVPHIFMPSHVSNKHGFTERGSLYDLLNDAVRAYVFGVPAAAIAMCRAALEMTLVEHYGLESTYVGTDGNTRTKPFNKLIALAEKQYEHLVELGLKEKKERADEILHRYQYSRKLNAEDDKVILNFLITLKTLIERAPK